METLYLLGGMGCWNKGAKGGGRGECRFPKLHAFAGTDVAMRD